MKIKSTRTTDSPLVSVIVTSYNYGHYLSEAIDSVLNQTYSPVEIIVIDDGSTDTTADVASEYRDKITYLYQENAGVVAARNNGAKKAKGEYLCFLDADDYLDSAYLEAVIKTFCEASDKVAYVYGDSILLKNGKQNLVKSPQYSTSHLMYRNYVPIRSVIRAKAFNNIGGFLADDSKGYSFEDWELWLSFAENGYVGLRSLHGGVSYYRLHPQGRNVTGEKYGRELRATIRKSYSKLYDNRKLYLGMRWYHFWHIFEVIWRRLTSYSIRGN